MNWDGWEASKCPEGGNHDEEEHEGSPSGANKQKEDVNNIMLFAWCTCTKPTTDHHWQMEEMFLRLGFSQTVAMKQVDDQWIDSPWTLASLSDKYITPMHDVIRSPGGLLSKKVSNRDNLISIMGAKKLKLAAFNCKAYGIEHVYNTSVLEHQHQWKLEQKKTDSTNAPKVDNNWAKTMENIVLHLKLVKGVRGSSLAFMVRHHIKVAHISPGYSASFNLDEEMIPIASIID